MKMVFQSSFTFKRFFQVIFAYILLTLKSKILESRFKQFSDIFYLDEWNNFLERVKCLSEEELKESDELEEELRLWASYRGQTLTRTGMIFCLIFFLVKY